MRLNSDDFFGSKNKQEVKVSAEDFDTLKR